MKTFLCMNLIKYAKKITLIPDIVYIYNIHSNSMARTHTPKTFNNLLKIIYITCEYFRNININLILFYQL